MGTVMITGASGGIGSSIARLFAFSGYNVVIHYNKNEKKAMSLLEELRACSKVMSMAVQADLSSSKDIDRMMHDVYKNFFCIDILINNAAVSYQTLFTDITDDEWKKTFAVNVDGAFYCTRAVIKDMIKNKNGSVINISSMWGETGASMEVAYSASKAALIGMTKALAKEVGLSGVRVNCITPGVIDTAMNSMHSKETLDMLKNETPLNRIGMPNDIAELALFLASDKASFITGQIIGCNGGILI